MKHITIDLLRHGDAANGKKLLGHTDESLSTLGWQQMRAISKDKKCPWQKIISSPLQRCRLFAEELASQSSLPLSIETHFQEIDFGQWDGQLLADLYDSSDSGKLIQFMQDPLSVSPPAGETYSEFRQRVITAWEALLTSLHQQQIESCVLITHSGVIRTLLSSILGFPETNLFRIDIPYACLTRIKHYEGSPPILHFHGGQL